MHVFKELHEVAHFDKKYTTSKDGATQKETK